MWGGLSAPMYFVRPGFAVLMGFSGALRCLAALSAKAFQTNAYEKRLQIGGEVHMTKVGLEY